MDKMKKVFVLLLSAGVLSACGSGGDGDGATEGTASSNVASSDAILNVQFDVEVASMDPQIATDGTSFEVIAAITEGLYTLDADGNAIPAVVESEEVSEDGMTYTFKLRDDAKWSNGDDVTANDFVFAWQRVVDPEVASEYNFIMGVAGVENANDIMAGEKDVDELGVVAVDDKTLEVTLDFPVTFFKSLMTFPSFYPMNEAFFTEKGDTYGTSPDTLLSNGPFVITSYEPAATTIELAKNEEYADADDVQLAGIKYQIIKDSQQATLSFQNGDIDLATLSGEQVDLFKDDPAFTNIMEGYLWYLSANQKVAGLENVNLRLAMAQAFDKDQIVNNVLKDGSIAADFLVPKDLATGPDGEDFRATSDTYLPFDVAAAQEHYEAAKKELNQDSFTYTMIVEDTEASINVAQVIKAQLEENLPGFTLNIEQMPKKNRVERMQAGDYEVVLTRWGPDYADPMTYLDMWVTGGSNNYGSWSNAEYDAIIASAQKGELATDPEARWEGLKEAEKIAASEAVIMPIYQKGSALLVNPSVEGVEFHSVGINRVYKNTVKN